MPRPEHSVLPPGYAAFVRVWSSMAIAGVVLHGSLSVCSADELRWTSPPNCTNREAAQQEIERLVGRPLADGQTGNFDVVVRRDSPQRVTVSLQVHRHAGLESQTRELVAGSCEEAADMAAVALAMAIAGEAQNERAGMPWPKPAETLTVSGPSKAAAAAPTAQRKPWRAGVGAQLALDHGALPGLGVGTEGDVSINHGRFRAVVLGSYFGRRRAASPDGPGGGEFSLLFGGLLGCAQSDGLRVWLLGCAGGELGILKAEGIGLTNPQLRDAAWRALRAELGAGWEVAPRARLAARIGLSVPLLRQRFVIEDTVEIHRAAPVCARGLLGLEFWL